MNGKHFVYILLTENNTLYCGYTDDVEKRFQAHLEGKGAKYTRANKPVKIEYRIKHKLSREEKLELIRSQQAQK